MSELTKLDCKRIKRDGDEDPRLSNPEKYWLQLSSYDLDKLLQLYDLQIKFKPYCDLFNKTNLDNMELE
jgi:hypothetical protein